MPTYKVRGSAALECPLNAAGTGHQCYTTCPTTTTPLYDVSAMQDSDPEAESTSNPLSHAADIPQELFEHIAWHAVYWTGSVPSDEMCTRNICTLALVSTYFAAICRPHIFRRVRFRDAKQIRGFLTLMDSSPAPSLPHVSTFVRDIHIEPAGSDDYWIYQITTALLPKLKRYCNQTPDLTLSLKGHRSLATPRTMMPILARSGIQYLCLNSMTFHRGEELLCILALFPALYYCGLASVALETLPDPVAIRRNLPNTSLRLITFVDCTPAIQTWLVRWLICSPDSDDMPPWDTEDAEAIVELTRNLDMTTVRRDGTGKFDPRLSSLTSEDDSSF